MFSRKEINYAHPRRNCIGISLHTFSFMQESLYTHNSPDLNTRRSDRIVDISILVCKQILQIYGGTFKYTML